MAFAAPAGGRAREPFSTLRVTEKPTPSTIKWDNTENVGRGQQRGYFAESDLLAILDAPGPSGQRRVTVSPPIRTRQDPSEREGLRP